MTTEQSPPRKDVAVAVINRNLSVRVTAPDGKMVLAGAHLSARFTAARMDANRAFPIYHTLLVELPNAQIGEIEIMWDVYENDADVVLVREKDGDAEWNPSTG